MFETLLVKTTKARTFTASLGSSSGRQCRQLPMKSATCDETFVYSGPKFISQWTENKEAFDIRLQDLERFPTQAKKSRPWQCFQSKGLRNHA